MATKFTGSEWDRTDVPVHFTTEAVTNIGELNLAKRAAITSEKAEQILSYALDMAKQKTELSKSQMSATITFSKINAQPTVADIDTIHVKYSGEESWCGGCLTLSNQVREQGKQIAEQGKQIADLIEETRVREERDKLAIALGDLILIVYRKLFNVAKATTGFPMFTKDGTAIDCGLFLYLAGDERNKMHPFLLTALKTIPMDLVDFKALVSAKRTRNEMFHCSTNRMDLLEIVESATINDFADARRIIMSHRGLFVETSHDVEFEETGVDDK